MLDFRITLEARNPARRCSRQYHVEAGTDLFGSWVVEISYGCIGTAGWSRSYVVRDEGEARHLAQSILRRRATAPRRIGVAYRVRELIDPAGWAGTHGGAIVPTHEESALPGLPGLRRARQDRDHIAGRRIRAPACRGPEGHSRRARPTTV